MRASRTEVNRVDNGCEIGEKIEADLKAIEENDTTGPGAGLSATSPYVSTCTAAVIDRIRNDPTRDTLEAGCVALGEVLGGVLSADGISDSELNTLRQGFIAKASDPVQVEYGEDAYDIASVAFDQGLANPRTGLAELAAQQKQDAAGGQSDRHTYRDGGKAEQRRRGDQAAHVLKALVNTKADAGALFEENVLAPASSLRENAPAEFERVLAMVKAHDGTLAKKWEKALSQREKANRKKEREDEKELRLLQATSASKGGRTAEAVKEDEESGEELPNIGAHAYGVSSDFDALNEYMRSTLFRLMNRDYSVVNVGGDVRLLEVTADDKVILHRPDALRRKFENVRIPVPDRKSPVNGFDAWMQWPGRSTHDGIGFYPGSSKQPPDVPPKHFNMWRGFAIAPKEGDWSLLHDHMLNVYCGGSKKLMRWFLDWVAQLLQEPQAKPGTSVVLRGRVEGTGKSTFAYLMSKLLGGSVLSASRDDQVAGRFNSHLQNVVLLVAEEAVYAGSKKATGILKDLITCSSMGYEAKGLPVITAPNYTRVVFISNEAHVVPAGPTSRRFAVFDCENPRANDKAYFDPLYAEIDKGGAEAFLHDMLERDITSDLRSPPITKALLEQRAASLDGLGKWLLQVAQSGQVVVSDEKTVELERSDKQAVGITTEDLREAAKPFLDPYEQRSVDHKLGSILKEVGAKRDRLKQRQQRPWGYVFPRLSEFRDAVAKHLGVDVEPFVASDEVATVADDENVLDLNARRLARTVRRSTR